MAVERGKTQAEKQQEGDRLDIEAYRNHHKAEFGFNPPVLTVENARAYFDDLKKREDAAKQKQLTKDQLDKDNLASPDRLRKDQLQKDEHDHQQRNKKDQLQKQQLQKDERDKQERLKKQQLQKDDLAKQARLKKDQLQKQDRLKKQQLLDTALHAKLTPAQIVQADRAREAKATAAFIKAQKSLATAAMLRQLSPEAAEGRNLLTKALDIVINLPGKGNEPWPQDAKQLARDALPLIVEGAAPELPKRGTNRFTRTDAYGDRNPIIPDFVEEAVYHCEQGVKHLQHEQFREAARDPAAAGTFFGQRPDWSRTGVPLDKPLDLKPQTEPEQQPNDLEELHRRLLGGVFYQDHDEDMRLMGVLRKHLDAPEKDRSPTQQQHTIDRERQGTGASGDNPAREYLTQALDHLDRAAATTELPLNAGEARQHLDLALTSPLHGPGASPWPDQAINHARQAQTILAELPLDDPKIPESVRAALHLCDAAEVIFDQQQQDRAEKDRKIDAGIKQRKDQEEQERRRAAFDTQEEAKDIRRKQLLTKADHKEPPKKEFSVFRDAKRERDRDKGRDKDRPRD